MTLKLDSPHAMRQPLQFWCGETRPRSFTSTELESDPAHMRACSLAVDVIALAEPPLVRSIVIFL